MVSMLIGLVFAYGCGICIWLSTAARIFMWFSPGSSLAKFPRKHSTAAAPLLRAALSVTPPNL
jgi:hypothetical protein